MPLSRHSVGTYQETSSHTTRQGTLGNSRLSSLSHCVDPGLKSGISVRDLIFTLKKKKKKNAGGKHSPQILAREEKEKQSKTHISKVDVSQITLQSLVLSTFSCGV